MIKGSPERARLWGLAFGLVLLLGVVFRLMWVLDMDYKADEHFMFERSQAVGVTQPWPQMGMPSGAGTPNPPLSIWIFVALARVFDLRDPTALARGVQVLNLLALALAAAFGARVVARSERAQRSVWLGGVAICAVNPLAIAIQRKIWAQSVLPAFSMAVVAAWWRLDLAAGAFFFGLVGILLGQIHLSGFFFFAALGIFGLIYRRREWKFAWTVGGAALGCIPMVPWLRQLATQGSHTASGYAWYNLKTLHFYDIWFLDLAGLDLKFSVKSHFRELMSDPLLGGRSLWLGAVVFGLLALSGAAIVGRAGAAWFRRARREGLASAMRARTRTGMLTQAVFVGMGGLMTLMPIPMQPHYLVVAFPLSYAWFASLTLAPEGRPGVGRALLATNTLLQAAMSFLFFLYIHQHQGAPNGDYGPTYGSQERARSLSPDRFR